VRLSFLISALVVLVAPQSTYHATHYVVVVDRSTSITKAELESYAQLLDQLVQNVSFGDRVTMFVAFAQGRRDGTKQLTREMPLVRNPANPSHTEQLALDSARLSLGTAARTLFRAPALPWSDLTTSLRQAGEQYDPHDKRRHALVLLSDMLHCVPGDLCLDRKDFKAAASDWLSREVANGTLPSLRNVCVMIVGAEQATARDANVREFWRRYFAATGADFSVDRYRYAVQGMQWREC
jgi:hypothetical protein